ncbi:hypothetical protein HZH68_003247 [Vespula germanica]|uniref:Uncharacterized protein n=1 Tax=Vespula germanica TaxID=30212 RepID=A0A834NNU9_VESGE|nr:hypothetical protein HZH68_003247 [Vespula germanica]
MAPSLYHEHKSVTVEEPAVHYSKHGGLLLGYWCCPSSMEYISVLYIIELLVVTKDSVNTVLNLSRRFDAIGENKDGGGKSLARFNVSAPLHSGYDLVRCKLIEVKAQESLQAI